MRIWRNPTRRDLLRTTSLSVLAGLSRAAASSGTWQISSPAGLQASVNSDGSYQITASEYGWTFAGQLGSEPGNPTITNGTDPVGQWQEIVFSHAGTRQ